LSIAQEHGTADDIGRAYINLAATLLAATLCDEAAQVAVVGIEHTRRVGMLASDGLLLAYNGAEALFWLGRWDEALALITAHALVADGPHGTTGAVLVARIAFARGLTDLAAQHRDLAFMATRDGSVRTPQALVCAGQIAASEGRFDEARRNLAEAVVAVEASDDVFLLMQVATTAMEIEADRVDSTRLRGSRDPAEAAAARGVADDVRKWAHHAVERLTGQGVPLGPDAAAQLAMLEGEHSRVGGDLDPDRWAAIGAQWDALQFDYPAAMARYREAEAVLRARGSRSRAADAARTALAGAERLKAEPLLVRLRLLAQRGRIDLTERVEAPPAAPDVLAQLGVSAREREVLDLVAAGRTNRQIAGELYISEKTASVHVTHLLRKLGVASRIEAAAMAQELRLGGQ
jgi:DNA-binding CsgD family transcriptional regulator